MKYQEQFARVRRFLTRIERTSVNPVLELPPEKQSEHEDMLWAFYQNSWHLKDWIKNDLTAPYNLSTQIEQLCKAYRSLMLCADLANGSKHLVLVNPRVGARANAAIMIRVVDSVLTGESSSEVRYLYCISDDAGGSYNAVELARQVVRDWEDLIIRNGGNL